MTCDVAIRLGVGSWIYIIGTSLSENATLVETIKFKLFMYSRSYGKKFETGSKCTVNDRENKFALKIRFTHDETCIIILSHIDKSQILYIAI